MQDPYSFSNDFQEAEPVHRRLRSTNRPLRQSKQSETDRCKSSSENDLLGTGGLGLSSDEFSQLPETERKELLEAALQSKLEFQTKERHSETGEQSSKAVSKTFSIQCSVPLFDIKTDTGSTERIRARPSLEKFKLARASEMIADIAKHDSVENTEKIYCRSAAKSSNPELASSRETDERRVRSRPQACGNNDDNAGRSVWSETTSLRNDLIWSRNQSSPAKQLVRKYRNQAKSCHPFLRPEGMSKSDHVQLIWNYFTEMEKLQCQQSRSSRTRPVAWGKPIPIEVVGNNRSVKTRGKKPDGYVESTKSDASGEETLPEPVKLPDDVINTNVNSKEEKKAAVLKTIENYSDPTVGVDSNSRPVDRVDIVLDNRWKQEDIESHLQNSRQTKIGGGIAEESAPRAPRKRRLINKSEVSENASAANAKNRLSRPKKRKEDPRQLPNTITRCISTAVREKTTAKNLKENEIVASERIGRKRGCSSLDEDIRDTQIVASTARMLTRNDVKYDSGLQIDNRSLSRVEEESDGESEHNCSNRAVSKEQSVQENLEESSSDLEDAVPSVPELSTGLGARTEMSQSNEFDKLVRPSVRDYNFRERKTGVLSDYSGSRLQEMNTRPIDDFLSEDDSSVDDDFDDKNLRKDKKRRRCSNSDGPFGKSYSKKKTKPETEQLTLKSFSAFNLPLNKIVNMSKPCPLCQKDIYGSEFEAHVQECVERDDLQKRTQKTA